MPFPGEREGNTMPDERSEQNGNRQGRRDAVPTLDVRTVRLLSAALRNGDGDGTTAAAAKRIAAQGAAASPLEGVPASEAARGFAPKNGGTHQPQGPIKQR